jgi:hypothetical protein
MRHAVICSAVCAALLTLGSPASAQVSIGITIGQPPPPPRAYRVPPPPHPEFVWVEGYWYPHGNGKHYKWHDGYWTRPPVADGYWVQPYYYGGQYFQGYWESPRRVGHDKHHDKHHGKDHD